MLALAIRAIAVDGRRRRRAASRPLAADVGPQAAGLGLARARCQHRDGGVLGVDGVAGHGVLLERVHQRSQQRRGPPDPVGERKPLQLDALAFVDLALAVERQVVGVLGDQHVREQAAVARPRRIGRSGAGA